MAGTKPGAGAAPRASDKDSFDIDVSIDTDAYSRIMRRIVTDDDTVSAFNSSI